MNICYLDTETGGVDPAVNPVLQIAAILTKDGKEIDRFDFKVKPFEGQIIDDKALACNGFTREQISNFEEPKIVLGKLIAKLAPEQNGKWFFCGYNAGFDENFMRRFFENAGGKKYGSFFITPHLDVMTLAAFALGDEVKQLENFKLVTVAKHFGVQFDETKLHDAMVDIEVTRNLMRAVYKRMKGAK